MIVLAFCIKNWRVKNKAALRAYMRKYRAEHPDYVEKELQKKRLPSYEPNRNN